MSKYYYTFNEDKSLYALHLNTKGAMALFEIIIFLLLIYESKKIFRLFCNLIFYANKKFTDDREIIDFAVKHQSNFKNAYFLNYRSSDLIWSQKENQSELPISRYQDSIDKKTLVEKSTLLFNQYICDLNKHNFSAIREYTLEPFNFSQNNFDLVGDYTLSDIVPLKFEIREELNRFIIQINGSIVNFKLSLEGYILSGKPTHRSFTEYWDIALDKNHKCYLVTIY